MVGVVRYGCMYQYKVGGDSQKALVRQLPGYCVTPFKLLADLN